jgi:hypothetical protein
MDGLEAGAHLRADVITKWGRMKNHTYYNKDEGWRASTTAFIGNRHIVEFDIKNDVRCFLVSGTAGVYLRSEGFAEFYRQETGINISVGEQYQIF